MLQNFVAYEEQLEKCLSQLNLTKEKFLEMSTNFNSYANFFVRSFDYQGSPIEGTDFQKRVNRRKYNNDFRYLKLALIYRIWLNIPVQKPHLLILSPIFNLYLKKIIEKKFLVEIEISQEKQFESVLMNLH